MIAFHQDTILELIQPSINPYPFYHTMKDLAPILREKVVKPIEEKYSMFKYSLDKNKVVGSIIIHELFKQDIPFYCQIYCQGLTSPILCAPDVYFIKGNNIPSKARDFQVGDYLLGINENGTKPYKITRYKIFDNRETKDPFYSIKFERGNPGELLIYSIGPNVLTFMKF